jgi:CRP/FNR family transcriptional regulator, cyclic AMP receptor protein
LAGSNKALKENEIVFKMGDPADCMYIVRNGKLKVFFTKGAEEIQLAVLEGGSIVGEMAFFDAKPRSASVRALAPTEVTVVTKADFEKLLSQVPKWMVTMMQSLVGRLRQTNEKLQEIEAQFARQGGAGPLLLPNQKHPFQHVIRGLKILLIAAAKEGTKEGTSVTVATDAARSLWLDLSGEELELLEKIIATAEQTKFVTRKMDATKKPILAFSNKGTFTHFVEFFSMFVKQLKPLSPFISGEAIALFGLMVEQASTSGYETLNVGFGALKSEAQSKGKDVSKWTAAMVELATIPDLKISKSSSDITVRIIVKEHKNAVAYLKLIQLFKEAKLA